MTSDPLVRCGMPAAAQLLWRNTAADAALPHVRLPLAKRAEKPLTALQVGAMLSLTPYM